MPKVTQSYFTAPYTAIRIILGKPDKKTLSAGDLMFLPLLLPVNMPHIGCLPTMTDAPSLHTTAQHQL